MIEIARVLKPHGIHGDMKVRLYSDNFDDFMSRGFAYTGKDGGGARVSYTALRVAPPFVYLHFDGADTRSAAEAMAGTPLFVRREDLSAPPEGEYYVMDLIGMKVEDERGAKLGVLSEVLQHGAADVYVVKGEKGFMFPALKRVIQGVDTASGVLRVNAAALGEVAVYDDGL